MLLPGMVLDVEGFWDMVFGEIGFRHLSIISVLQPSFEIE